MSNCKPRQAEYRASVKYFSLFPYESHKELRIKLLTARPEERKRVFKSFKLPFKEIENNFKEMTLERIHFAHNRGHKTYIDMHLAKHGIPQPSYQQFIENKDKVISYCHRLLPEMEKLPDWFYSEFNLPCFICLMSSFPFKNQHEVLSLIFRKNKLLKKSQEKINIRLGDESKTIYFKDRGAFEIVIDENANIRHKILDLIHELAHTYVYLSNSRDDQGSFVKGSYQREKEALRWEMDTLKTLSLTVFPAIFGQFLLVFHRVLFEIEIYTGPLDTDLSSLYARIFNQCFKGAKQKKNLLYIFDERIVLKPLSSLPHAVSQAEFILESMG